MDNTILTPHNTYTITFTACILPSIYRTPYHNFHVKTFLKIHNMLGVISGTNARTAALAFPPKCKYNRGIETK